MIRNTICLLLLCSLFVACGGGGTHLTGSLKGLDDGNVYAVFESPIEILLDTTIAEKGAFELRQGRADFPIVTLYMNEKADWLTIYPEKGKTIKISGNITDPASIRIKGGRINNKLTDFRKKAESSIRKRDSLLQVVGATSDDWATVNKELGEHVQKFISKNKNEEASAILIDTYLRHPDNTALMEESLSLLGEKVKDAAIIKDLREYISEAKQTQIGHSSPDFMLLDIFRKRVSKDGQKGKFTLLSFTKSFPDRMFPGLTTLKELEKTYSKDTLQIVSVVLNTIPHKLREIAKKDTIDWYIVADSAGQALELIENYHIQAFPYCYILDKEGKIAIKSSNDKDIKEKLDKLLQ